MIFRFDLIVGAYRYLNFIFNVFYIHHRVCDKKTLPKWYFIVPKPDF